MTRLRPLLDDAIDRTHGDRGARATRRLAAGFTAIEVLIAMTIMFIGAAAVMSMQKTAIQGNLDARKADVASAIAHSWIERIRHESMRWTQPTATSATSNLPNIPGLNGHIDKGWFRPNDDMITKVSTPGSVEAMSYGFDILGRDLAQGDFVTAAGVTQVQFCAEARITTLVATSATMAGAYRIDVRVVWPRGIGTVPNATVSGSLSDWPCSDPTKKFTDPLDYTLYRAINVTTAITENPAP